MSVRKATSKLRASLQPLSAAERDGGISIKDVRVTLGSSSIYVVDEITLDVRPGEIIGLVGESGSGKTTAGLSLLGYARAGLQIAGGAVRIGTREILSLEPEGLRMARLSAVAYIPQDPGTALNPALSIRTQLSERLNPSGNADDEELFKVLRDVKLPADTSFLDRFPHEMSGGQQQRIGIALAFAGKPRLIVMDEPTTGLDVTTQAHILQRVRSLCKEHAVAAIYVSHDLAVVANIADRVAVLYSGKIVEYGDAKDVLFAPRHPYTKALIRAVPRMSAAFALQGIAGQAADPSSRPQGCTFAERCDYAEAQCLEDQQLDGGRHPVRCWKANRLPAMPAESLSATEVVERRAAVLSVEGLSAWHGSFNVLHDLNFELREGECLALVGESGSGKTTLSRVMAGLHPKWSGRIKVGQMELPRSARNRSKETLRRLQYIFQNPYASLNPRRTIGESVGMALNLLCNLRKADARRRTLEVLDQVALPGSFADRYPRELSGGQRQRAAIARAIAVEPEVLICDEITSALDVSVQAVVVELLANLQRSNNLTMLFVTHNLPLVCNIAQRILVMKGGRIVDEGSVEQVIKSPTSEETRRLISDAPDFAA